MAKTSAERQAEYRARQQERRNKRRLNIWLSEQAHGELQRQCDRHLMSQQSFMEYLFAESRPWKKRETHQKEIGELRDQLLNSKRAVLALLCNDLLRVVERKRG